MMMNKTLIENTIEVLESLCTGEGAGLYETEYDGRTYMLCLYCNYNDEYQPHHDDSCAVIQGRRVLNKLKGER